MLVHVTLADSAVSVHGLRKSYGERTAVDGVDLDIPRGEVFALLGPNGAGKTTTVEILEGYRSRDAGEVSVLGVDPAAATPQWRARVGIVLQSVTDLSELTVTETVRHFAGYYPRPRDPDEVIATVGLDRAARRNGPGCSPAASAAGSTSRSASSAGPSCCSSTSPPPASTRRRGASSGTWSRASPREGTTILLTTHYLEEAERLADRVAVIAAGAIVEVATPAELGGRQHAEATVSLDRPGRRATRSVRHRRADPHGRRARGALGGEVPGPRRSAARRSRTSTCDDRSGCRVTQHARRDGDDERRDRRLPGTLVDRAAPGRASSCCSSPATARRRSSRCCCRCCCWSSSASAFTGDVAPGITFSQYFLAGMIASGIVYTSFQNLAIAIPQERDDGTLKRLQGTPMPKASYFVGKIGLVLVIYVVAGRRPDARSA